MKFRSDGASRFVESTTEIPQLDTMAKAARKSSLLVNITGLPFTRRSGATVGVQRLVGKQH
jgi:hypothetical protein